MNYQSAAASHHSDDYINTTVVFGEIRKIIISKDFKGGKIHNFFGCTELDFTYADLTGTAILDVSQACGTIEIIVPCDWRVDADLTQFCAVVDDERRVQTQISNKILMLKGISGFANIEINSY